MVRNAPLKEAHERASEKLTFRISPELRSSLEYIAERYGQISLTEALRRAIGTEKFLLEEQEKGSAVLVESEDGSRIKQLVLR